MRAAVRRLCILVGGEHGVGDLGDGQLLVVGDGGGGIEGGDGDLGDGQCVSADQMLKLFRQNNYSCGSPWAIENQYVAGPPPTKKRACQRKRDCWQNMAAKEVVEDNKKQRSEAAVLPELLVRLRCRKCISFCRRRRYISLPTEDKVNQA